MRKKVIFFRAPLWSHLGVAGVILAECIGISWTRNAAAGHTTPQDTYPVEYLRSRRVGGGG